MMDSREQDGASINREREAAADGRGQAEPTDQRHAAAGSGREQLHGLIAAFQFLTRIPLPVQIDYTPDVFRRSTVFFPLAGMAVSLIVAAAAAILSQMLPPFAAAAALLIVWVAATGALHLDGLMDTADGILSHRPREQMLEIMKDSRVGAFGVIVCVLYLLLKCAMLQAFMILGETVMPAFVPVWSRWFMVAAIAYWPYARPNSGLGGLFRGVGRMQFAKATATALAASVLLAILAAFFSDSRSLLFYVGAALFLAAPAALLGWWAARRMNRKLGGLTGDTYGALNELIELALLVILWRMIA
jgi:adenosylcobinamide-phosphate synthase/adenosylcobinamide-GDP ribazoletransferase